VNRGRGAWGWPGCTDRPGVSPRSVLVGVCAGGLAGAQTASAPCVQTVQLSSTLHAAYWQAPEVSTAGEHVRASVLAITSVNRAHSVHY
jgi:hypothetical protein